MNNAKENQENQGNRGVQCPICDKEFKSNHARGIHQAKTHNKKNTGSAQSLFRKLRANLNEERAKLDTLISAVDHRIEQGK